MTLAWRVFAVFAAAHFLSYFFRSANAVIADELTAAMGLSPAQLGLMSSLFFGAFALAQLPFGSLLDRYGARRTTSTLMLAGVVGAVVFAAAPNVLALDLGRALMGLGTAGILMGGLKALSQLHPPGRFAAVSGMLTAFGSSGALVATAPLALLDRAVGWRAVFAAGAGALLLAAALIHTLARAPRTAPAPAAPPAGGFADIFGSGTFWRLAFLGFAAMGTTFAYQGLWAGPYLTEAAGLDPLAASNVLLLLGIGLILGFFTSGWLAQRFGVRRVLALATTTLVLVQVTLALAAGRLASPAALGVLLFALAASGSFSLLLYAQANVLFPEHLTGRAVTAINLFMFLGGFALQWGIGAVVGSRATGGSAPASGFATALLLSAALCAAALLLYLPTLRQERRP